MKTIELNDNRPCFQGDLMIRRVQVLPDEARLASSNVVAHSETGHNHIVEGGRVFDGSNPMLSYVVCERASGVQFVHQRDFDTHETINLMDGPGTIYEVRRQREYTAETARRVED